MTQKTKTRIQRITIGRLYNLGNYEHVRYELSVEVPEGRSAGLALRNIMRVLKAANPKPPIQTYDYETAIKKLADPEAWHENIANVRERKEVIKKMVKESKDKVALYKAWIARRKAAERMMDDIGGTRVFKDAKLSWNDDDDYGFEP